MHRPLGCSCNPAPRTPTTTPDSKLGAHFRPCTDPAWKPRSLPRSCPLSAEFLWRCCHLSAHPKFWGAGGTATMAATMAGAELTFRGHLLLSQSPVLVSSRGLLGHLTSLARLLCVLRANFLIQYLSLPWMMATASNQPIRCGGSCGLSEGSASEGQGSTKLFLGPRGQDRGSPLTLSQGDLRPLPSLGSACDEGPGPGWARPGLGLCANEQAWPPLSTGLLA